MKKYACLILFAFLLNGCDDGDLTVDQIDFEDIETAQSCDPLLNTLLYKLKPQESLLLQLPVNTILNDATKEGEPLVIDIETGGNGAHRVLYRAYDGAVAVPNICGQIPPKTPSVTEEWLAISGKIVITSVADKTTDEVTKATKITGYTHNINFQNITFEKPSGPNQVEVVFPFGTYKTTVTTPVVVEFTDETAKYCKETKKIFNDNGTSALVIKNIADGLIVNQVTPTGQPRTQLINATSTTNNVFYEVYSEPLPTDPLVYFCTATTPLIPSVTQSWVGQTGVAANNTGIIEVTTTEETNVFRHKVVLKATTVQKGNSSFYLGTEKVIGSFVTAK